MASNSSLDLVMFVVFSLPALLMIGYIGILAWFKTRRFKQLVQRRLDNNKYLARTQVGRWMRKESYLWFVRILSLVGVIGLVFGILFGLIGLVS